MVSEVHGADWVADAARGYVELGEEFASLDASKLLREAECAREVIASLREENARLLAALDKAVTMMGGSHMPSEWDAMRERLLRHRTKAELHDIARAEGAPCSGYKEEIAAQIVSRRRRLAEGRPEPPAPPRFGDYGKVERASIARARDYSDS